MTRRSLRAASLLLAAVVSTAWAQFPPPPTSQPAETRPAAARTDLPTARTLFDRGIESMGGRAALKEIKSSMIKAVMNTPMGPMTMEMYAASPDKFLIKRTMAGMGEMSNGCDGTVHWGSDPMGGYQVHDMAAAEEMRGQATLYDMMVRLEKDTAEMATVDDTMFGGKACYKVRLTDPEGNQQFAYFDKLSGLLSGAEQSQQTPQGPMSSSIAFSDWKKLGDLNMFHKVSITQGPMVIDMILNEITFNSVPDSMFDLPEAVQQQVKDRAPEPATQPATQPGG